jgi:hypothetical protein
MKIFLSNDQQPVLFLTQNNLDSRHSYEQIRDNKDEASDKHENKYTAEKREEKRDTVYLLEDLGYELRSADGTISTEDLRRSIIMFKAAFNKQIDEKTKIDGSEYGEGDKLPLNGSVNSYILAMMKNFRAEKTMEGVDYASVQLPDPRVERQTMEQMQKQCSKLQDTIESNLIPQKNIYYDTPAAVKIRQEEESIKKLREQRGLINIKQGELTSWGQKTKLNVSFNDYQETFQSEANKKDPTNMTVSIEGLPIFFKNNEVGQMACVALANFINYIASNNYEYKDNIYSHDPLIKHIGIAEKYNTNNKNNATAMLYKVLESRGKDIEKYLELRKELSETNDKGAEEKRKNQMDSYNTGRVRQAIFLGDSMHDS